MTTYAYDAAGDLISVTDAAGRTVSHAYDKKHNLVSITDPMGVAVSRNEYDDDGRLIATIDADGNRIEYKDLVRLVVNSTDSNKVITFFPVRGGE